MLPIVQIATYVPGSAGNTIVFTLPKTPTPGNILVAFTGYSQYGGARTITGPAGFVKIEDQTQGSDSLAAWWYPIAGGDGVTWVFNISGTNEWRSGVIYEIAGANVSAPIDKYGYALHNSQTPNPSASLTPDVLGTLGLAGITYDGSTLTSQSAGWALRGSAAPSYHKTYSVARLALTTDISTPISVTFTPNNSATGVSIILLLAGSFALNNQVAGEPNCKADWRFEPAAHLADSKGGNTLAYFYSDPVAVDYEGFEGAGCIRTCQHGAATASCRIADASLDAGFPFKSGDTQKKLTFCGWIQGNKFLSAWGGVILAKTPGFGSTITGYCLRMSDANPGRLTVELGIGGSQVSYDTGIDIVQTDWYHVSLRLDGAAPSLSLRVWRWSTGVVQTYSVTPSGVVAANNNYLGVGGDGNNSATSPFNGYIDEFIIWDRLLTDAEIDAVRAGTYLPPLQTLAPTGIPSEEAFGTPIIELLTTTQTLYPSGISSEEAFGTPTIVAFALQTIELSGIPSEEAFGIPVLLMGLAPCRSLTRCQDIPAPLAPCRSLTTVAAIQAPQLGACRSLTTCGALGLNPLGSLRSLTRSQTIPLQNGGLFPVF